MHKDMGLVSSGKQGQPLHSPPPVAEPLAKKARTSSHVSRVEAGVKGALYAVFCS